MAFSSVRRLERYLVGIGVLALVPVWVVGLKWLVPDSRLALFFSSLAGMLLTELFRIPGLILALLALYAIDAGWTLYLFLAPGTLFDREARRLKGMPYARLVPHLLVLGLFTLTLVCRDSLHLDETLASVKILPW